MVVSCGIGNYDVLDKYASANLLANVRNTRTSGYQMTRKTHNFQTHHDILVEAYKRVGEAVTGKAFELGTSVYWNILGGDNNTTECSKPWFPVQADTPGTMMISGFAIDLVMLVAECRLDADNYKVEEGPKVSSVDLYYKAVGEERYDPVHGVLARVGEGVLAGYLVPERELMYDSDRERYDDDDDDDTKTDDDSESDGDVPNLSSDLTHWEIGEPVLAKDHRGVWCPGKIADITGETNDVKVKVHFDKYSSKWDETYDALSDCLRRPEKNPTAPQPAPQPTGDGAGLKPREWSVDMVRHWLDRTIGVDTSVLTKVVEERVDGKSMDLVVTTTDRETLGELGVTSRLVQNRIFTQWE